MCLLTVEAGNEQVRVRPSVAQIHLTISGALRMPFGCLFWCSNMIWVTRVISRVDVSRALDKMMWYGNDMMWYFCLVSNIGQYWICCLCVGQPSMLLECVTTRWRLVQLARPHGPTSPRQRAWIFVKMPRKRKTFVSVVQCSISRWQYFIYNL